MRLPEVDQESLLESAELALLLWGWLLLGHSHLLEDQKEPFVYLSGLCPCCSIKPGLWAYSKV